MIEAFKVGITIALMNRASSVLGIIARDFSKTDAQAQRLQKSLKNIGLLTIGGAVVAGAGMAGLGVVSKWYEAATAYEQAFARFRALNLGEAVNRDADKFAQATSLMGVSATDLMTTVTDLHTVFGNYAHARAMAPMIARMEFANKAVYGDATKFDSSQALTLGKVIEMRGGFKSEADMKSQADFMQHVMAGTGGRVMPADYLTFLKTAGVAGRLQSNQNFYYQMEPFIQEMGGSRVGTALMSAYQNLGQGRTTARTAKELARLGMIAPGGAEYDRVGQLVRVKPGAVKGGDMVASDPMNFLKTVLLPTFAKHGITSEKAIINEIGTIFTNRTAASLYSLAYLQQSKVAKNIAVDQKAMGVDALTKAGDNTPMGMQMRAQKAWENFQIQMGLKVIPIILPMIEKLANGLQYLAMTAQAHPGLAKWLALSFMGLSALAVVIGTIAMTAGALMLLAAATGGAIAAGTALIITGIAAGITLLGTAVVAWWPQISKFFGWIASKAGDGLSAAWKWAWTDPAKKFHQGLREAQGYTAGPWAPPPKQSAPVHVTTNLNVDGKRFAQVMSKHQGNAAQGPSTGPARPDSRLGPMQPSYAN